MSALNRVVALLGIYFCSLMMVAVSSAQVSGAAVSMTCAPGQVQVEVKPGATLTGYTTCTVSNPTAYAKRSPSSLSDGLATAPRRRTSVPARSRLPSRRPGQPLHADAVPRPDRFGSGSGTEQPATPNTASSQVNALINIMQFSIVQVEAVEPFVQLMPKTDKNFEFKVYNFGNQIDRMKIGVTENLETPLKKPASPSTSHKTW